jgi:hypothetical protein
MAARFRLFKLDNPRLGHAKPATELRSGHAQRVPDGPEPTLRRSRALCQRAQGGKSLVEMADGVFHVIRYII